MLRPPLAATIQQGYVLFVLGDAARHDARLLFAAAELRLMLFVNVYFHQAGFHGLGRYGLPQIR